MEKLPSGLSLGGSAQLWTFLESFGWLWIGSGKLRTALNAALATALERIWKVLYGLDGFGRGLDGSGWPWAALDSFG